MEAFRALRAFAFSDAKVGLFGVSRGAEHALLVTSLMVRDGESGLPDAVAALAPPDVICGAFDARTWKGASDCLLPTTPIAIEDYDGPFFLAHGKKDKVWSSHMTERLTARLRSAGRAPEVHLYEDQGHVPDSAGENVFNADLIGFFERTLCQ